MVGADTDTDTDTWCAFDKLLSGQQGYPMLRRDARAVPHVGDVLPSCPMNEWGYGTDTHHSLSSECTKHAGGRIALIDLSPFAEGAQHRFLRAS